MVKFMSSALIISATMFAICTFTNAFSTNSLISNPSQNLRGYNTPQDIIITDDVELHHLLHDNAHSDHLRRLGPIPSSKAIKVPCQNTTSDCGIHGICRISGENKFCHCDEGYYSLNITSPCSEKGKSQFKYAILWYFFGWSGGPAFGLGWIAIGLATLLTCCCGVCCISQKENDSISENKRNARVCFGFLSGIACFGLWIYVAVMVSGKNCVDSNGVPCNMW